MPGQVPPLQSTDPNAQEAGVEYANMVLRAKNIKEYKSTLTLAGTLVFPNGKAITSGINVTFKNKGVFNGKWIIQKEVLHIADHKLITEIELRKCMVETSGTTITTVNQPDSTETPSATPPSEG
jgi:hypothetical protein